MNKTTKNKTEQTLRQTQNQERNKQSHTRTWPVHEARQRANATPRIQALRIQSKSQKPLSIVQSWSSVLRVPTSTPMFVIQCLQSHRSCVPPRHARVPNNMPVQPLHTCKDKQYERGFRAEIQVKQNLACISNITTYSWVVVAQNWGLLRAAWHKQRIEEMTHTATKRNDLL